MFDLSFLSHAWPVLLGAFFAGLVDSMGGGGGLISAPALLISGVPAPLLLGTNKSMSTLGSIAALFRYTKAGLLPRMRARVWVFLIALSIVSAVCGAALSTLPFVVENLRFYIPILLFAVMVFIVKRWWWDARSPAKASAQTPTSPEQVFLRPSQQCTLAGIAGYDGLFGPGTGTFFMSVFERLGFSTLTSNAITKVFNFSSNLGALAFFAWQDKVIWKLGLTASSVYILGNYLGAGLVLRKGHGLVRGCVCVTTTVMLVKYAWQNW